MMPSTFPHNPTYTCRREFVHGWKEIGRSLSLQYRNGRSWFITLPGLAIFERARPCLKEKRTAESLTSLLYKGCCVFWKSSAFPSVHLRDCRMQGWGAQQMVPTRWTAANEPQIMKHYIIIHNTSILCQSDVQVAPCAGFLGNISESKCSHVLPPSELHHQLIGLEGTL